MGEVWRAEDTRLHRQVALKMVRPADDHDVAARARLMHEAQAAAALNHPHIATVHDVLEDQGEVVIVFEYVEGETLSARIARGPVPAPEAVDIATQIAKALTAAHAHGIVHRDLKPSNIIVAAGQHVKVLDFGIARMLAVGTTQTAASGPHSASLVGFVGTASYAAPEQLVSAAVDERADLYALGVVLFELITGQRPFLGNDPVKLATSKLGTDAPPLSATGRLVPPELERLVALLLSRDPEQRPQSAAETLNRLNAVYGTGSTRLIAPRPRRSPLFVALGAVVAVLTIGMAVRGLRSPRQQVAASSPPVVAVLPLSNMSGDATKEFVAAGIAESLISSLAPLRTITVLSRGAVAEARSRSTDPRKLIRDLGATYLVDGSVQESGDLLRISVNLIRPDQSIAWADSVQGRSAEIFDLQSRLATMVAGALRLEVSPADRQRMMAPITASTTALEKYWQGRALFDRRDAKGNLDGAVAAYSEAVQIDPGFALAQAALGEAYWFKYLDTREAAFAAKATDAGYTALRLDANAPAVRYALAVTLAGTGKLDEAVLELRKALTMQPNYDDARRQLGQVLVTQGHIDDAIVEFDKAIAARPDSWTNYSVKGRSMFVAGRQPEAIAAFEKVTELQPDNAAGFQQLGTAYQQAGDYDRAVVNYKKALAIRPFAQAYSNLGALYHLQRDYKAAVEAYRSAIELRPKSAATHRNLGDALARLGLRDQAIEAYQAAVTLTDADLKVNPRDAVMLASSAVYLAKVGDLPQAWTRINQAIAIAPKDNVVRHREAIVNMLAGKPAAALQSIRLAIAYGYARSAIGDDDEFESLRSNASFKQLVAH